MMNFSKDFTDYISAHSSPEDALLQELTRATHLHAMQARMLSGHVQGKFLELISKMISPSNILEIGTFTGYSAICLAKGLTGNGILHTIDINDELRYIAEDFISRSSVGDKIKLYTGDALTIIPQMDILFDLVFIDGDKREYSAYYNLVIEKVRQGGYIIADNVLWSGKILDENVKPKDKFTVELQKFNDLVQNDDRVENLLMPVRDGIMIVRVKN
ncbi:MAG: class I SAM-dependent methyltransferase [Prevotellaceae bacterium]|jgi:predicted O-methyltransferase YrrM|nr:class I SAM-dependent methyltransferase [Prevotellaceae bacterium]